MDCPLLSLEPDMGVMVVLGRTEEPFVRQGHFNAGRSIPTKWMDRGAARAEATSDIAQKGTLEMEGNSRPSSSLVKRSIVIRGNKTSISLENIFWEALKTIAIERNQSVSALVAEIEQQRETANLSSATRVFVLRYFRESVAA